MKGSRLWLPRYKYSRAAGRGPRRQRFRAYALRAASGSRRTDRPSALGYHRTCEPSARQAGVYHRGDRAFGHRSYPYRARCVYAVGGYGLDFSVRFLLGLGARLPDLCDQKAPQRAAVGALVCGCRGLVDRSDSSACNSCFDDCDDELYRLFLR